MREDVIQWVEAKVTSLSVRVRERVTVLSYVLELFLGLNLTLRQKMLNYSLK